MPNAKQPDHEEHGADKNLFWTGLILRYIDDLQTMKLRKKPETFSSAGSTPFLASAT